MAGELKGIAVATHPLAPASVRYGFAQESRKPLRLGIHSSPARIAGMTNTANGIPTNAALFPPSVDASAFSATSKAAWSAAGPSKRRLPLLSPAGKGSTAR